MRRHREFDLNLQQQVPHKEPLHTVVSAHEQLLQGFSKGRYLADCSYGELRKFVADWLGHLEVHMAAPLALCAEVRCESTSSDSQVLRVRRALARRAFDLFSASIGQRSHTARAFVQLFCSSRLHRFAMAYLSLQEGEDWDTSLSNVQTFRALFQRTLSALGKKPQISVTLKLVGVRVQFGIDPTVALRRMYTELVVVRRRGSLASAVRIKCLAILFQTQCVLLTLVARAIVRLASRQNTPDRLASFMVRPTVRRPIIMIIRTMFPSTNRWGSEDWTKFLQILSGYFSAVLPDFFSVVPEHSLRANGLMKLAKMAAGVLAYRASSIKSSDDVSPDEVLEIVRCAYSWGVMYPLVDNVIDSPTTSGTRRDLLLAGVVAVCDNRRISNDAESDALVVEVSTRLKEVLDCVPGGRRDAAARVIMLLTQAHARDACRSLREETAVDFEAGALDVWVDGVLKAALVRAATLEVSGIQVCNERLSSQLKSGLLNQFGDDLWDIREDLQAGRVTPFTLFWAEKSKRDPYLFFSRYCQYLAQHESGNRQIAAVIGLQETMRCFLETGEDGDDDVGKWATERITEALRSISGDLSVRALQDVPHLDFDPLLFKLGSRLLVKA